MPATLPLSSEATDQTSLPYAQRLDYYHSPTHPMAHAHYSSFAGAGTGTHVDHLQLPKGSLQHCILVDRQEQLPGQRRQSTLMGQMTLALNKVRDHVIGGELCRSIGITANYRYSLCLLVRRQ